MHSSLASYACHSFSGAAAAENDQADTENLKRAVANLGGSALSEEAYEAALKAYLTQRSDLKNLCEQDGWGFRG